jgi:hypothetical protein
MENSPQVQIKNALEGHREPTLTDQIGMLLNHLCKLEPMFERQIRQRQTNAQKAAWELRCLEAAMATLTKVRAENGGGFN